MHLLLPAEAAMHHICKELLPRVCLGVRLLQRALICWNREPILAAGREPFRMQLCEFRRQGLNLCNLICHIDETAQIEMDIYVRGVCSDGDWDWDKVRGCSKDGCHGGELPQE